eukprot:2672543-Rhodomonas_salina.3
MDLGVEGAGRLAGGRGDCTALTHLEVDSNELGGEGAARLATGLGGRSARHCLVSTYASTRLAGWERGGWRRRWRSAQR